ncbi:MAG: hypothetical protein ACTHMS_02675 [Jatrophihabitans sp.]|uniref:hypothetical protein n=1 Tax=Jatrophihabitans sp. TaxID=1932789 RepID=UPI003F8100A7
MRWEGLFADLAAQAEALERAERAAEIDERTRGEAATLGVLDRLRAAVGTTVRVGVPGVGPVTGRLGTVGADWLLVDEGSGREALVPVAAVLTVRGIGRTALTAEVAGPVAARLRLTSALRGVARDRSAVRVHLVDGTVLDGTLDRVGRDHLDVAAHAPGEPRRAREVREIDLVPFAALALLRRLV